MRRCWPISATSRGPCHLCPTPYSPPGSDGGDGCGAVAGYQQAGGLRQTIAHSAERVFGALSPTPQGIAKDVFLRLTALGDGTQDTRRRVRRAELVAGRGAQAIQAVLERLAEARPVTLADDSVEVAHEALIGSVLYWRKVPTSWLLRSDVVPGVAQWPSGLARGRRWPPTRQEWVRRFPPGG